MQQFATSLVMLAVLGMACSPATARTHRSHVARAEFKRMHPCPATGQARGACPGYVIDHIKPLACGGADAPENMAWQTVADARAKDKIERQGCTK